jgi:hypothetical protein
VTIAKLTVNEGWHGEGQDEIIEIPIEAINLTRYKAKEKWFKIRHRDLRFYRRIAAAQGDNRINFRSLSFRLDNLEFDKYWLVTKIVLRDSDDKPIVLMVKEPEPEIKLWMAFLVATTI